jgi:hypothetical protein
MTRYHVLTLYSCNSIIVIVAVVAVAITASPPSSSSTHSSSSNSPSRLISFTTPAHPALGRMRWATQKAVILLQLRPSKLPYTVIASYCFFLQLSILMVQRPNFQLLAENDAVEARHDAIRSIIKISEDLVADILTVQR